MEISKEDFFDEMKECIRETILDALYVCPESFQCLLQENKSNWMDAAYSCPENEDQVLVWDGEYDEDKKAFYQIGMWLEDREYFVCPILDNRIKNIKYWMPLPKPEQ